MVLGYAAILITLLLWSVFFLSLKGGAISELQPADIALARFLLPALVMLPFVFKHQGKIRSVPNKYLFGIVVGCGLPYLLVASTAMQYVPVSHGSALIPGTLPLFVSAIAVMCYQQPLSRHRVIGLCSVLLGIVTFLISNVDSQYNEAQLQGHLLLLLGCFMWAAFTISARVANLNAYVTAGFTAIISLAMLIVAVGFGWLESYLAKVPISQWPWQEVINHVILQGLGAGIIASFTFLYAVRTIGAEASAALGSLTPVVATLLAIPIFHEHPDIITWCALILVTCGSIVASNVFMKQDPSQTYRPPAHK
ncbi:DMT family transporter [Vibrio alfacsensis]|uniref:DMT family transporter n=1 Tax=Vibrio alfacsensis TaxID=1074311 RepID=UPI0040692CF0